MSRPVAMAASVSVPPEQLAARHADDAPGKAHAVRLTPLQVPPQSVPSVAHAERLPIGEPLIAAHVPTLPVLLQASHWLEHAPSQHTPSAQKPEPHSVLTVQVWPLLFVAQAPLVQACPPGQACPQDPQ